MKKLFVYVFSIILVSSWAIAQLPTNEEFRAVPQFPQPAEASYAVVGTADNDGHLILWNGDSVYRQETPGGAVLEVIAEGYLGDPAFAAVSPNQDTLLLGTGYGLDGTNQKLYLINLNEPVDFMEGDGIPVPNHYSGAFLSNTLVILDRGKDDFTGTELIVIDTSIPEARNTFVTVVAQPASDGSFRQQVIDKPESSYSSRVFVDRRFDYVYSMDGNALSLHRFDLGAVIDAFESMTMLDWDTDGTEVGTPGTLFSGGVSGLTQLNELVVDGADSNFLGGVQIVQNLPKVEVLTVLDPAGTQPFYNSVYIAELDEIILIDGSFGQPLVGYARETGIAPIPAENACDDEEAVLEQFELLKMDFPALTDDIDEDMVPDTAMLNLFLFTSCRVTGEAVIDASHNAYDQNLEILDLEANAGLVADYREILAVLFSMNADLQTNVISVLMDGGITLTGDYIAVTCSDTDTCLPEFVEDPVVSKGISTRAADEPFSGSGDLDGDTFTNLEEYTNIIAIGGDEDDFAVSAFSDELDGTAGNDTSGGGSCFIAHMNTTANIGNDLQSIRFWRDNVLLENPIGTMVASVYYQSCPSMISASSKINYSGSLLALMGIVLGGVFVIGSRNSKRNLKNSSKRVK